MGGGEAKSMTFYILVEGRGRNFETADPILNFATEVIPLKTLKLPGDDFKPVHKSHH